MSAAGLPRAPLVRGQMDASLRSTTCAWGRRCTRCRTASPTLPDPDGMKVTVVLNGSMRSANARRGA